MPKIRWVNDVVRVTPTADCPPGFKMDPRRDKCVPAPTHGLGTSPASGGAEQPAAGTVTLKTDELKLTLGGPRLAQLGAADQPHSTSWDGIWTLVSLLGMGLSAYHGYARNKSVGWGIGWGVAGAIAPIITVPIAVAQGFGKPASGARANPAEPFVEVGRFEHEGEVYEAGGAYYDRERGLLAGYVRDLGEGSYTLIKWDGSTITPLRLVKKYRGGFGRGAMYAWSATYDGRVFSGRNGGPAMILRMRARKA